MEPPRTPQWTLPLATISIADQRSHNENVNFRRQGSTTLYKAVARPAERCVSLVGTAESYDRTPEITTFTMSVLSAEIILGYLTFTGSLIAFGKLQEVLPTAPFISRAGVEKFDDRGLSGADPFAVGDQEDGGGLGGRQLPGLRWLNPLER